MGHGKPDWDQARANRKQRRIICLIQNIGTRLPYYFNQQFQPLYTLCTHLRIHILLYKSDLVMMALLLVMTKAAYSNFDLRMVWNTLWKWPHSCLSNFLTWNVQITICDMHSSTLNLYKVVSLIMLKKHDSWFLYALYHLKSTSIISQLVTRIYICSWICWVRSNMKETQHVETLYRHAPFTAPFYQFQRFSFMISKT